MTRPHRVCHDPPLRDVVVLYGFTPAIQRPAGWLRKPEYLGRSQPQELSFVALEHSQWCVNSISEKWTTWSGECTSLRSSRGGVRHEVVDAFQLQSAHVNAICSRLHQRSESVYD